LFRRIFWQCKILCRGIGHFSTDADVPSGTYDALISAASDVSFVALAAQRSAPLPGVFSEALLATHKTSTEPDVVFVTHAA
jgi:hypothetical protein